MPPRLPPRVTRRRFLAGSGAAAGAALLGGCGDDGGAGAPTAPGRGVALVQLFGGLPMLATGAELRAPFGVADGQGLLPIVDTPEVLTVRVLDEAGEDVTDPVEVARHAKGLPRAYFPLRFTVEEPGVYAGRAEVQGETLEMAIKVDAAEDVPVVQVGQPLPAVATPTTADAREIDPICTADPVCPLHEVTVATALSEARPMALLVAAPAFCQMAICGPVLDVLVALVPDHPSIRFVHAEVFVRPEEDLRTKAPVVDALGLTFEPCLVLADASGTVVERLDTIYDESELAEALGRLA